MTLAYGIVVIDDQPDNIKAVIRQLREEIALDGFDVQLETIKEPKGVEQLAARKDLAEKIDIFLVDKNLGLGNNQDGARVIKKLRARAPHIPVLFYSGDPAKSLRERVAAEGVDGVYCCSRKDIRVEALNIFRAQARSILAPNAIRGMFVGAVSQLEHKTREALLSCTLHLAETGSQYVRTEIVKVIERTKENLDAYQKLVETETDIKNIIDGQKLTSADLLSLLRGLLSQFPEQREVNAFVVVLETYLDEVIHPRNVFAHGLTSDCGKYVQLNNRRIELSLQAARTHNQSLKRHSANIDSLLSQFQAPTSVENQKTAVAQPIPVKPSKRPSVVPTNTLAPLASKTRKRPATEQTTKAINQT